MEQKICPYLCLTDDPSACKEYPYEGNACHRVKKPVRVKLSYQRSHCLTEDHVRCVGFINGWETGFPKFLQAPHSIIREIQKYKWALLALAVIILVALIFIFNPPSNSTGQNFRARLHNLFKPPATATLTATDTPEAATHTKTPAPTQTRRPSTTPNNTATETATQTPTATLISTATPSPTSTFTPTQTVSGVPPFIYLTPQDQP